MAPLDPQQTVGGRQEQAAAEQAEVEEWCGFCGERLVPHANFCHRCGAQVLRDQTRPIKPPPPAAPLRGSGSAPAAGTDGQLLWEGRPSRYAIGEQLLVLTVLAGIAAGLISLLDPAQRPWVTAYAVAALLLIGLVRIVPRWYTCASHSYRLTSRALWVRSGLLREVKDRYALHEFISLSLSRSVLDRLFGIGSIELHFVRPGHAPVVLYYVPDADRVAELFDQAIAAAAAERRALTSEMAER